jgi:hypothetical protein
VPDLTGRGPACAAAPAIAELRGCNGISSGRAAASAPSAAVARGSSAAAIAMISTTSACALWRSLTSAERSLRKPHSRASVTSLSRLATSPSRATRTSSPSSCYDCPSPIVPPVIGFARVFSRPPFYANIGFNSIDCDMISQLNLMGSLSSCCLVSKGPSLSGTPGRCRRRVSGPRSW